MTTQISMREQMARAVYNAQRAQTCSDEVWAEIWRWHTNPDVVSKGGTWEVVRMVDAMLDALMDPTEDMYVLLEQTCSTGYGGDPFVTPEDARNNFQSMIRAIKDGK